MTTNEEREALAALVAGVVPGVWALWCEEGLPSGVYRLRDEARATADRILASDVWRNRPAVQGDAKLAGNSDHRAEAPGERVRLDHLLGVYRVGSGDWPWTQEYDNLIDQPGTQKLLARIKTEGIREPILLGNDGRVWDGHHRIVIAMHLGLDSVPVEWSGSPDPAALTPDGQEKNR